MFQGLEVIASDLYLHEVVGRVVSITTRVLSCERITLFLADGEKKELTVLASADDLVSTEPSLRAAKRAAALRAPRLKMAVSSEVRKLRGGC